MTMIVARHALTDAGWQRNVAVSLDGQRIASIAPCDAVPTVGVLLPAPGNLHSHAFQRAMAGLTEKAAGSDDFWSWRTLMYRFLDALDPDDVEAIAAGLQMEMLEAGYAAVGEFHYVHNAPGGMAYDAPAELAGRIVAAARATGIGLTLLPVIYTQGGLDGRPLEGGQRRFDTPEGHFAAILAGARDALKALDADARLGVAPHSLRAVPAELIREAAGEAGPKHIHVAEQVKEVEEVRAHTGTTPVSHLMDLVPLSPEWTLIHATHTSAAELTGMAEAGVVAGLCPLTESNLGDGIFDAQTYLTAGGRLGVGSDSNVRISLVEELRTLEYSQRLARGVRNPLSAGGTSSGRTLWQAAARGSAHALARDAGTIAVGRLADLVALDDAAISLADLAGDAILDGHLFAGDDRAVRDVWSAGRHVVRDGQHVARERIEPRFRATLKRLRHAL
ncbi:MAG: formimidoylglutamate deiminase [Pseudomonadota bacterium]